MASTAYDVSDAKVPPRFALTQFTVDEFFTFWPQLEEMLERGTAYVEAAHEGTHTCERGE